MPIVEPVSEALGLSAFNAPIEFIVLKDYRSRDGNAFSYKHG